MPDLSINIKANAQGAAKQVDDLGKRFDGFARKISDLFGTRSGGAAAGAQAMGRGMQQLTRQLGDAKGRADELGQSLKKLADQHRRMSGAVDLGMANPEQLKELEKQISRFQRLQQNAQRRASDLGLRLGTRGEIGEPGGPTAPRGRGGQEPKEFAGDLVGAFAGRFLGPFAGLLTATGIAGLAFETYKRASNDAKGWADLLPRLLGPQAVNTLTNSPRAVERLTASIRAQGRGLGFTGAETQGVLGQLMTGGGGKGIRSDMTSVMQMSRMFGLDAGGQASMFAEAQRMGTFRSGDARKFAQMLAQEIGRTGLGPRAEEVQQATLMLLNSQMQTQARASALPAMQLQAFLARTGIPAFQGVRGAGLLTSMQGQFENPGSDTAAALDQLVMRRMGITSFFKQQRFREGGFLKHPELFANYLQTVRQSTPRSGQEDVMETIIKERFPGLSYDKLEALRKSTGGFQNITAGAIRGALGTGGPNVAAGAKGAMGLPGNRLRFAEATLDDVMIRMGTVMVNALTPATKWLAEEANKLTDILDMNTTMVGQLQALTEHFIGKGATRAIQHGFQSLMGADPKMRERLQAMADQGVPGAGLAAGALDLANRLLVGGSPGEPGAKWHTGFKTWKDQVKSVVGASGLHVSSENRPGAITRSGRPSLHSIGGALDITGDKAKLAQLFDTLQMAFPGMIDELFYSPKGFIKHNRRIRPSNPGIIADHFSHLHLGLAAGAQADPNVLRVIIEEHGVVSEHSKAALRKAMAEAHAKNAQAHARAMPNQRNPR